MSLAFVTCPLADPAPVLGFALLGPLEVRCSGTVVATGPRQRRQLLLRLLVEKGQFVSPARLCEDLWNGRPPSGAMSAVRAHISRLRTSFAQVPQSSVELVSGALGYALGVAPHATDTHHFERAGADAARLLRHGRPGAAVQQAERALALWRGPALADAADHGFAADEIWRLEELRSAAEETLIAGLSATGRTDRAIVTARALTRRQPLRESAWVLLVESLGGVGRAAEAVREYERARRLLRVELSVGPGPELRRAVAAAQRAVMTPGRPPRRTGVTSAGDGHQGCTPARAVPGPLCPATKVFETCRAR